MVISFPPIGARAGATTRLILLGPALVTLASCATPPREYTDPRPVPTAEQRAAFGTMGIAPAGLADPRRPRAPASKSNLEKAGVTAGAGAVAAGAGALYGLACGPAAFFCVPVFAAVGGVAGVAGGMYGTLPYRTGEQVNNADITLRNALLTAEVEDRLVETILAQASGARRRDLRRVGYSVETHAWVTGDVDGGVDTRVLIAAPEVALVVVDGRDAANPEVRLEVVVEGQIFQGDRQAPTFERRWLYDSESHSYFDWAHDGGDLVTTEIGRAIAVLGARIAADFLGEGSLANRSPGTDAQGAEALTALAAGPYGEQRPSQRGAAAPSPVARRSDTAATGTRKLRVAILPFASMSDAGNVAEAEIETYVRRFVARRQDMELVYSAYDASSEHPAIGAAISFWSGGYVSKSPDDATVYAAAEALGADLVFTCFYQKRVAGHYSDDAYRFVLYLLDVREGRWYRQGGDERSVGTALDTILWQLPPGDRTS